MNLTCSRVYLIGYNANQFLEFTLNCHFAREGTSLARECTSLALECTSLAREYTSSCIMPIANECTSLARECTSSCIMSIARDRNSFNRDCNSLAREYTSLAIKKLVNINVCLNSRTLAILDSPGLFWIAQEHTGQSYK